MVEDQLRKLYLDTIGKFIKDTLNYRIKNAEVTLTSIKLVPFRDVKAFVSDFADQHENKYWMELDFPDATPDTVIHNHPAYKLLKNIKEGSNNSLHFLFRRSRVV